MISLFLQSMISLFHQFIGTPVNLVTESIPIPSNATFEGKASTSVSTPDIS